MFKTNCLVIKNQLLTRIFRHLNSNGKNKGTCKCKLNNLPHPGATFHQYLEYHLLKIGLCFFMSQILVGFRYPTSKSIIGTQKNCSFTLLCVPKVLMRTKILGIVLALTALSRMVPIKVNSSPNTIRVEYETDPSVVNGYGYTIILTTSK